MGRPQGRFTVAKSFTLNLQTAAWLEEECIKRKKKASAIINDLVERERIKDRNKEIPLHWCNKCSDLREHYKDNKYIRCKVCGVPNEALQELVRRQS